MSFVILALLLGTYALSRIADLLNLRALRQDPPPELAGLYDADEYRRSQEYTRAKLAFGMIPATFDLLVLLAFWGLGGFGWLDSFVRGFGLGPIAAGLAYIGILAFAGQLLSLPFEAWSTFVIEERFGFNRTTPGTFFADLAKGTLLAVVLGAPLLAAILWFFEVAGPLAWLYCWGVTVLFLVAVQFIAPTWIMPLFNRFEPLDEGELRDAVLAYARSVSFPLEGLFVIDGSKRSTKANAFFTGFGRHKRVALFDTLIEKHSVPELVGVVAHEIGHYKRGHIKKMLAIGIAQTGVMFFLLSLFLREPAIFEAFGVGTPSTYVGLVLFSVLFAPVSLLLTLGVQAFSRRNEFEADAFARETLGSGEDLARALEKLSTDSLQNLTPHPFYVALHHSHPPLAARLRALRSL
ncbi:MAG TPA: M48 family peptidase [Planctomycetes bacterium]|nr:M48 family peptidase [Planctomycetota bacterium]